MTAENALRAKETSARPVMARGCDIDAHGGAESAGEPAPERLAREGDFRKASDGAVP